MSGFHADHDIDSEVIGKGNALDFSNADVSAFDLGFSFFEAIGTLEADGDEFAFFIDVAFDEPDAEEEGDDGNDPDLVKAACRSDIGLKSFFWIRGNGVHEEGGEWGGD